MLEPKRNLGFLQICADRRFFLTAVKEFEMLTGLSAENQDYWIEAKAGGSPGITDTVTADYAYEHGARIMGWAAHGNNCGGFPGTDNKKMRSKLEEAIENRKARYPDAEHYGIFSTEDKTYSWKIL